MDVEPPGEYLKVESAGKQFEKQRGCIRVHGINSSPRPNVNQAPDIRLLERCTQYLIYKSNSDC
jgi:hypothetical protein